MQSHADSEQTYERMRHRLTTPLMHRPCYAAITFSTLSTRKSEVHYHSTTGTISLSGWFPTM